MSIVLLFFFCISAAQEKQYAKYAEEAWNDGDFISAAHYYQKVYDADTTKIAVTYRLAQSHLNYNAYKKAYPLFVKVHASKSEEYPALYYMAMINKYFGNYELSAQQFTKFTKESKDKSSFIYQSAVQEVKAAKVIPRILKDTLKLNVFDLAGINSSDAEFSAALLNDSVMFYSALRQNDKKEYALKIYTASGNGGWWAEDSALSAINEGGGHSANGAFNAMRTRFVYSRCANLKSCKLVESNLTDSGWSAPVFLPDEINLTDSTVTHPFLFGVGDKEILLFSSNRAGGKGGMDIWYSERIKGKYSAPKNIGTKINTPGNEITPFYNLNDTALYFSSDWHAGIGGQDIFKSKGELKALGEPVNVGLPLNSNRDDKGLVMDATGGGFFSSTREGTITEDEDAICCSDLYRFEKPYEKEVFIPQDTLPYRMEEDFITVSVVLYFHNDEPNPRTRDTLTKLNYLTTYNAYKKLQPEYEKLYPDTLKGDDRQMAEEDIRRFFEDYVDQGMRNLEQFSKELLVYLDKGYSAEVVVKGFASPLTKSDYNVNLSLRRISSFVNFLKEYRKGEYQAYLNGTATNGAKLTIIKEPNGEYKSHDGVSDDYYDVRNSIYSPFAAIERRIEVVAVNLIPKEKKEIPYNDNFKKIVVEVGDVQGNTVEKKLYLKNTSNEIWEVERLGADCSCTKLTYSGEEIRPGEYLEISFSIDLGHKLGSNKNILILKKTNSLDYQMIELRYNVIRE